MGDWALADLQTLWIRTSELTDVEFATFLTEAFPDLVASYESAAAELAASWFEESLPRSSYVAVTADLTDPAALRSSANWALDAKGGAGFDRLAGTTQRTVFNGARNTTLLNVERTGARWARHARPDACAFCRMLATRGAAYLSRETAATKVHDHCYCIPIEVRQGDYEPPDYAADWEIEYRKARAEAGVGSPKEILAAWRRQQGVH